MKLLQLLKSIDPIRVFYPDVRGTEPNARKEEDGHPVHRSEPHTDLSEVEIGSIHYRAQEVKAGGMFVAIEG